MRKNIFIKVVPSPSWDYNRYHLHCLTIEPNDKKMLYQCIEFSTVK